ncbi:MAG: trypsin-like peptidase domain-containing protein [Candidatus Krumholzibacteriota bacterium]
MFSTIFNRTFLTGLVLCLAAGLGAVPASAQADQEWSITSLSDEIRELTRTVSPAVVQIYTSSFGSLTGSSPQGATLFGKQQATGSGIILDPKGYILTNNHVVEGAKRVQVRLSPHALGRDAGSSILETGGDLVGAQIIGVDKETDLAVLKINRTDLPFLKLGDSDEIFQGQLVFAFGSPMGLNNSVSFGVISTVARQLERDTPMIYIQSDVAVNPGNSGGPLVNARGEVIGINTLIFTQSGGSEGLSFSSPSNIAKNVFNQIRATGRVKRGIIGVNAQTLNPWIAGPLELETQWGVILGDVYPQGPADAAGLQVGDIILTLDGKPMENSRQFEVNLYNKQIGGKVALEVMRGGKKFSKEVEVIERVDPDYRFYEMITAEKNLVKKIGVLAIDLDKDSSRMLPFQTRRREGVVVASLAADVNLLGDHFQPGDVIYTLNGQPVKGLRSLKSQVKELAFGAPAVFHIERGGMQRYLVMQVE